MDPDRVLNLPKQHRATFIAFLCALLAVIVLTDLLLPSTPSGASVISGYLRSVAAAIITALFVLWIVGSFMPPTGSRLGLIEIEPKNITKEFDSLLSKAHRWRYKGNFGRYMRGKVLPTLASRPNVHISVCVLDPTIKELCEEHARYRSKINAIDKGVRYDADAVALEVLVTIVVCAWYVASKGVAIEFYLTRVFDPVRIDSNDEAMILTVEDRRRPALMVTREHFTYEHFDLQMRFARTQAKQLDLRGMRETPSVASIRSDDISTLFGRLGMSSLCEQLGAPLILQACKEAKNPYED